MRNFAALALALTLGACSGQTSVAAKPTNHDQDVADLTTLKKITWRALYDSRNADGLAAFLADDFVLISNGGFASKKNEVDWMRENSWSGPEDFFYTIEDIIFITDDAAIIYGRGTSTRATEDGVPCAHSYISSNTVRRDGQKWQPVSSHVSDSKCEPIKTG